MKKTRKKIYLDYAASTPIDPRVVKKMTPLLKEGFGNTMSLHSFGQQAKEILEESREAAASLIGAKSKEIIFTSSATESNNLALKGIALARRSLGKGGFANRQKGNHIIISSIEHPCVMESAEWLESQGFEITRIPVNKYGLVEPEDIEKAIRKETILVSIIQVSNEIGVIQPIAQIGKLLKTINYKLKTNIYFHTDASQSFGKIPIDVNKLGVDLLTASSHKIYGPKGAALLFVREGVKITPLLHGGGQERGLRASTVNSPAIAGFAEAIRICKKEMKKDGERLAKLGKKLTKGILKNIPGAFLNGEPAKKLSNIVNFWFEFVEGESIAINLDLMGISVSTGSACSSMKLEANPVLLAVGLKPQQAHGSLRISLGRFTKEKEIDRFLKVLPGIIQKLRKISPFKQNYIF